MRNVWRLFIAFNLLLACCLPAHAKPRVTPPSKPLPPLLRTLDVRSIGREVDIDSGMFNWSAVSDAIAQSQCIHLSHDATRDVQTLFARCGVVHFQAVAGATDLYAAVYADVFGPQDLGWPYRNTAHDARDSHNQATYLPPKAPPYLAALVIFQRRENGLLAPVLISVRPYDAQGHHAYRWDARGDNDEALRAKAECEADVLNCDHAPRLVYAGGQWRLRVPVAVTQGGRGADIYAVRDRKLVR